MRSPSHSEAVVAFDALQNSSEFFRQIVSCTQEGIAVLDPTFRYRLWNSRLERLSGLSSDRVIGQCPWEVFSFFPEEETRDRLGRVLLGETVTISDIFADPLPIGRSAWVTQMLSPIRDGEGRVVGIISTTNDITERKKAELEVRATQVLAQRQLTQIQAIVSNMSEGLIVADATGFVHEWNPAALRIHGFRHLDEARANLSRLAEIFHVTTPGGSTIEFSDLPLSRLLRGETIHEVELNLHRPDIGLRVVLVCNGALIRDADGKPELAILTLHEVTEHRRAESQRIQTAAMLNAVVDQTTDAVFVKDTNGRYLLFNNAAAKFVGIPSADVIGRDDLALFDPSSAKFVMERDQRIMSSGVAETEEELLTAAGVTRTYLAMKAPFRDEQGHIVGLIGMSRDITERKKLESQLQQSRKMEAFGQLAAGVAHDFNNLLTVILGYSEILLMMVEPADPNRAMISDIQHAGNRAASLTRQLLAFSRKTVLKPKILDLNDIVSPLGKMLQRLIGEEITLSSTLDPALMTVKVDPSQIEQMLLNLVVNARDAMPHGGRITIETHNFHCDADFCRANPDIPPGRYVLLSVSDTGHGMTPEVQARIFEPFFTTRETGKGTGLGLATVLGIVQQSEGYILVDSRVGVGTTFRVLLPPADGTQSSPGSHPGFGPFQKGSETILLVEDEHDVRKIARRMLESHGYRVLEAANGADALTLADTVTTPVEILVTDVVMPGMNGRQLAERLLVRWPGLRILYMSGYTDDIVVRRGVHQSEVEFLQKPFTPQSLVKKVREVLDAKSD